MKIVVHGGQALSGEVTPSGSKNSAVAVLTASILFKTTLTIEKVPNISDITRIVTILEKLGAKVDWNKETHTMHLDNTNLSFENLTKEDLGNMKGATMLWGAMLGRFNKVNFDLLPGGCTLGVRPVDAHFNVLRDMGVEVEEVGDGVRMDATNAKAQVIWLTEMSPTATANGIMMAAVLKGKTTLIGAASEPSVQDLCWMLEKAGVKMTGIGSSILEIEGTESFASITHKMLSDHHEIATFLALGAITGGEIKVHDAMPDQFVMINREFKKFNIDIEYEGDTAIVRAGTDIKLKDGKNGYTAIVRAQPWPALPVDMLPLFVPLALKSPNGSVLIHNWMYEGGLFWTNELLKFGANVVMADPHRVMVTGGNKLKAANIDSPYIIRAVVAYIMCALIAEGESVINNADPLFRGLENFAENLNRLGAHVEVF